MLFNILWWFYHHSILWIILGLISNSSLAEETFYRVDPLALLAGTLRTYQRAGCDREYVTLTCPRGTSISIDLAQYGKTGGDGTEHNLCPISTDDLLLAENEHRGTEIEIKAPESCSWPHALQYSLLQTVVEACQKKRHCKFLASPKAFGGDPCPGVRKFVEVAYKCRPYEFRSKVACENDVIQLICNPYSRIAIYSATYGRTQYESIQCTQPTGVKDETCLVSYATETVMQICHGRRKCTLSADSSTFGKPCPPAFRMYLKVVYTCVPRKVLKDRFETAPEPDEPHQTDLEQDQDDLYDDDQFFKETEAIPPAPKLQGDISKIRPSTIPNVITSNNIETLLRSKDDTTLEDSVTTTTATGTTSNDENVIDYIGDWMRTRKVLKQNQERFYLYLIISITAGILLCLIIVIGRLLIQKHRTNDNENTSKVQNSNTGETSLPNGFSDEISEIDADIDLTTSLPVSSVSRSEQTYAYSPAPSPYGNLGPSNISHTSTTMLVPQNSMLGGPPPSIIGGGGTTFIPSMSSNMGLLQPIGMSTLPRHGPPAFMGGSIIGHTLRRPSHEYDSNTPRSLTRGSGNAQQYYYG